MTRRLGAAAVAVGLVLALVGCSASAADPVRAVAAASAAAPAGSASATADGVELRVTGFHVLPPLPGDPVAERAAASLGVPLSGIAQLHLLLQVHNPGPSERTVAGDALRLAVGGRALEPVPGPLLPAGALPGGSVHEAAAGFWVALRAGSGSPVLRWTHGDRTTALPLGGVRRSA